MCRCKVNYSGTFFWFVIQRNIFYSQLIQTLQKNPKSVLKSFYDFDIAFRACVHGWRIRFFEHNFAENKGAGVQWTPLLSRSTDRDDSRDSKI